jgi:hypothetical protein
MPIVKEIEKVIAQLPPRKACVLKFWLNEFKAARRYKQLKAYKPAFKALAQFKRSNTSSLWN